MPETTEVAETTTATEQATETETSTAATGSETTTEATEQSAQSTEDVDWRDRFEAQRKINRDLERKLKDERGLKDQVAELQAKIDGKEAEHQATVEAQRIKDEALTAANERILKANIRAEAAAKLTDPKDALLYLDLSEFEVNSDGEVDTSRIAEAIDDLIKEKPYLAAQGGKRFQGTADGGARNESAGPTQLTRSDLERMTPAEIDKATREGRFVDVLAGKK